MPHEYLSTEYRHDFVVLNVRYAPVALILDLLFHRILSRPPPSDPAQTFTRKQLVAVLHLVHSAHWPEGDIAAMLGFDVDTVRRVVAPFMGVLLHECEDGIGLRWKSFRDFLSDLHRSGEFHVPSPT